MSCVYCYRVIPSDSCGVNNEVQWRTCNNSDEARSPDRYFCREVKVRQAEGTTLRILADGVTTTTASYHAVYPVVLPSIVLSVTRVLASDRYVT